MSGAGCTNAKCGPGTQRSMTAGGGVECVDVTVAAGTTTCDADAGVSLIDGNRCVATTIQCGPGTQLDPVSQQCLAVTQNAHDPPVCTTPAAGHICANGTLRNLVDGSFLSGETLTVTFYDAATFFGDPTPAPLAEITGVTDTYMLATIPTPQYLMAVTHDPTGGTTYQATGIALTAGMDGQSLRLDAYVVTKAQYAAWALPSSFESQGPLFYRFFNDPPPPANARTPTETHPTAGVTLDNGTAADPNAHYFGSSLAAIDSSLMTTSATGAVITTTASLGTFTGMGGGVTTWEAHMGLPVPNILQVDFMHPMP